MMIVAKICVYIMAASIVYYLLYSFYYGLRHGEIIESIIFILLFLPMIVFLVWYVLIRFILGKKIEDD